MAEVTRSAKVGALVVLMGGALYLGYGFISRTDGAGGGYRVWAHLPDVTGIAPKSRVTISGIQVGYIDRISLDKGQPASTSR